MFVALVFIDGVTQSRIDILDFLLVQIIVGEDTDNGENSRCWCLHQRPTAYIILFTTTPFYFLINLNY